MNFTDKINQLKNIIDDKLKPIIDNDYILYDLPYHNNIGDLLIWEGEQYFLKSIKHQQLAFASYQTINYSKEIPENAIILLHGGGNFGDIWDVHNLKRQIIELYPNNKIIIFPQTVHYQDKNNLLQDSMIMTKHKNLTICARDTDSYKILKENFPTNNILLVPDMAFYIPYERLQTKIKESMDLSLYVERHDKELAATANKVIINNKFPIQKKDWPSINDMRYDSLLLNLAFKLGSYGFTNITDWLVSSFYKKRLINKGISFVSIYKEIFTTRLHVAILSILLKKSCYIIDNSYGKNSSFYTTWLHDLDGVTLLNDKRLLN